MTDDRGRGAPADAVLIGVTQILRRPGVQHPLQRVLRLGELRVGEAVVPAGTPVELDLVLEASGTAVVASGVIRTVATCGCRRCLEPFDDPVVAEVREVFEPRPTEGETYPVTNEQIDVVPFVRDAVLLMLPLAPLCRPDCAGPSPDAVPVRPAEDEAGPPDAASPPGGESAGSPGEATGGARDPRWAALDQLRLDR